MDRVSPEVFLSRVIEATTEMERLNKIDEGRLWITNRGMRHGGVVGFVACLYTLFVTTLFGMFATLILSAHGHEIVGAQRGMIVVKVALAIGTILSIYFLRWRAMIWLVCFLLFAVLVTGLMSSVFDHLL